MCAHFFLPMGGICWSALWQVRGCAPERLSRGKTPMTEPSVLCITQARMTSHRLPGKVMERAGGNSILGWHLGRLQRSRRITRLVVATVQAEDSRPICDLAQQMGVPVVMGDEQDVLGRFALAADQFPADIIVRVTSDCPLIDPVLVDRAVDLFCAERADYASNGGGGYPRGFDVEVFSARVLRQAQDNAVSAYEREHVTPYIYQHPEQYRLVTLGGGRGAQYRLCVDEPQDLAVVRHVLADLADRPDFGWEDVVQLMDAHPQWAALNAQVVQKTT